MRKILYILLIILTAQSIYGFETGKNPTKAALMALVIPGTGQYYNESYIKAGTFLTLQCYFVGNALYHHKKMNDAYDKVPTYTGTEDNPYINEYNSYYNKTQNDYWWIGATALISSLDAYVDAHLYNFKAKKKEVHLKFTQSSVGLELKF